MVVAKLLRKKSASYCVGGDMKIFQAFIKK